LEDEYWISVFRLCMYYFSLVVWCKVLNLVFCFFDTLFCVFVHTLVYSFMVFTWWFLVIGSDSGFIMVFSSIKHHVLELNLLLWLGHKNSIWYWDYFKGTIFLILDCCRYRESTFLPLFSLPQVGGGHWRVLNETWFCCFGYILLAFAFFYAMLLWILNYHQLSIIPFSLFLGSGGSTTKTWWDAGSKPFLDAN